MMSSGPGGSQEEPRSGSLEELQLDTIHSVQSRAGVGPNSISRPKLVRKYAPAYTSVFITWLRTESWRVNHSQVRHQVHGFVVPASTSSHPILTLMLWRGPSAQTYWNGMVLESRTIHSSITSWAPHYPADTEFPSEGRRSTAPGRQKQAEAGRATRFPLENMSARDDPMAYATDIQLDSRRY